MMWNEAPAFGRLPLDRTFKAPPSVTDPETQSDPVLGVPDGLRTTSSNVPPVCA